MKRISTVTSVPNKWGAGKSGFTDGDVVGGVAATDLEAALFDNIQEEIANVIEASGVALNASVVTQLLTALRSTGVFQTQVLGDNTTKAATTAFVKAAGAALPGRLLNVQSFTSSGTYTPTPGTKVITVEIIGGGGSGAGVAATGASQASVSTGGSAGAFARCVVTLANLNSVAITIGAGGAAISGFASNSGGSSSYGSGIICPGGPGGGSAGPTSTGTPFQVIGNGYSAAPTISISGATSLAASGGSPQTGFSISGLAIPTVGVPTTYGSGGGAPGGGGGTAPSFGAGGGGCGIGPSTAAQSGGAGGNGICLIYEYGAN